MSKNRTLSLALGLATLTSVCLISTIASAAQRDINEFISQQGTVCLIDNGAACGSGPGPCYLFVPPVRNFIGWTTDPVTNGVSFDYAGLANAWLVAHGKDLGTTMDGSIVERPQRDGRALVSVVLRTHNALTWASKGSVSGIDFNTPDLLLGNRVEAVLGGAAPALGDCLLQVTFYNTAPGAPMPDLNQLFTCPGPGQELVTLAFEGMAQGPLHALFGVPEGTPGFVHTRQMGLLNVAGIADPHSRVAFDAFPAERIFIQPLGK